jgi:GNAT superfamily N-acetyltransferase
MNVAKPVFETILPLAPGKALDEFSARLQQADIHGRFGRAMDAQAVSLLLAPQGPAFHPFGALRSGALVGAALLADLGGGVFEFAVVVRSDMKRRRIGRALADHALLEAARIGGTRLLAEVRADNRAALALLRSAGFTRMSAIGLEMTFAAAVPPMADDVNAHAPGGALHRDSPVRSSSVDEFGQPRSHCWEGVEDDH